MYITTFQYVNFYHYNDIVKLFRYMYFIDFMVIEDHKFIEASLHFASQYLSGSTQMIKFDCSFRGQTLHISQTQFIIMMYAENKLLYTSY